MHVAQVHEAFWRVDHDNDRQAIMAFEMSGEEYATRLNETLAEFLEQDSGNEPTIPERTSTSVLTNTELTTISSARDRSSMNISGKCALSCGPDG